MADTAFQKQYRQEFIAAFEKGDSLLRSACITETVVKGNEAIFLVAGTGGAEAVTRGVNGLIPARPDDLTQNTATLVEWHDKPRRTNFNIFASQGDGRRIMQNGTVKVMNRKIEGDIIAQLDTATVTTGAAASASLSMVAKSVAILGNGDVPVEDEDNMFALISPAFRSYLLQVKEFANAEYVTMQPFNGPPRKYLRWNGINWITSSLVTGKGTAAEKCYLFHRDSIGHAVNAGEMNVSAGYNDEDDYYWARSSVFMGSKKLQNSGIVQMLHDGSEYAA